MKKSQQKAGRQLAWEQASIQDLAILEKWVAPQDILTMYSETQSAPPQESNQNVKNTDVSS